MKTIGLALSLFLVGCSIPQTQNDFRTWADGSSVTKKGEFSTKGSRSEIKERMSKYATKCLNAEMIACQGDKCRASGETFNPTLSEEGNRLTLTLQFRPAGANMSPQKIPDKGQFIMLADMTNTSGDDWKGKIWSAPFGYGDLYEDTLGWLEGKQKLCPKLR